MPGNMETTVFIVTVQCILDWVNGFTCLRAEYIFFWMEKIFSAAKNNALYDITFHNGVSQKWVINFLLHVQSTLVAD
jgi:hypothetical protein